MTTKNKPLKLEEILELVERARSEWAQQFISAETIRQTVHDSLDNVLETAIYSFLGLRKDYRGYEIDHCNGRKSTLRSQIESLVESQVPDLVKKHVAKITTKLSSDEIEALRKEYKERVRYALREAVREKAQADAQIILAKLTGDVDALAQQMEDCQIGGEELAADEVG